MWKEFTQKNLQDKHRRALPDDSNLAVPTDTNAMVSSIAIKISMLGLTWKRYTSINIALPRFTREKKKSKRNNYKGKVPE